MINEMANKRPKYTKYEIANLVKRNLDDSHLPLHEFCIKFDTDEKTINAILEAKRSFNKNILSVASRVLNISIKDLLAEEVDNQPAFRSEKIKANTEESINIANLLFNEIIMQKKISV